MQHVTDVTIVPEATAEFIAGLLERIERLESDLATAEQDSRQKQARIERLEEEECKQAALLDCLNEWKALAKSAEKERDALRAKIDQMEKQEPVGWTTKLALEYGASTLGFQVSGVNMWGEKGVPLYALPGAQHAPSVPVDLITDYLVSISAHVAHQEEPQAQAEIRELLRILAAAPEAKP